MDWLTWALGCVCLRMRLGAWPVEKLMAWAWTLVALGWLAGGPSRGRWLAGWSAYI